jgi:hypothetical protein
MFGKKKSKRPLIDYRMTFRSVFGPVHATNAVYVDSGDVVVTRRLPTRIFLNRQLEAPAPPKELQAAGTQTVSSKVPIAAVEKHLPVHQPIVETAPIEQAGETNLSGAPESLPTVDFAPSIGTETEATVDQGLEQSSEVDVASQIATVKETVAEPKRKTLREGAQVKVTIRFRPKVKLGRGDFINAMDSVLTKPDIAALIESTTQSKKHVTVQLYATSQKEADDTIKSLTTEVQNIAEANVSAQPLFRQRASAVEQTPVPQIEVPQAETKIEEPQAEITAEETKLEPKKETEAEPQAEVKPKAEVEPEELKVETKVETEVEKQVSDEKTIVVPKTKGGQVSLLDLQQANLSGEDVQCIYPQKEKLVSKGARQEEELPEGNGARNRKNNGDPDALDQ